MMFIGYLYGIRSERQLEREIRTNIAYRWFLGLKFKRPSSPSLYYYLNPTYKKDGNTFSKVRKSVLQYFRLICLPVDWSGGHSTPAGYRGHWRPRRRQSAEEASGPPRGKRVPGAEINRPICRDHQKIRYLDSDKIKNCRENTPFSTNKDRVIHPFSNFH